MSEILFGMRWTTYAFSKFQSARGASHYPAFMGNCWLQMLALADPKRMVCKLIRNHGISHPNHFAKKVDMLGVMPSLVNTVPSVRTESSFSCWELKVLFSSFASLRTVAKMRTAAMNG